MTPNQEDVDRAARELYIPAHRCQFCGRLMTLAEQLQGRCPQCQAFILAGPDITPERGRAMLDTLRRRRVELGLSDRRSGAETPITQTPGTVPDLGTDRKDTV